MRGCIVTRGKSKVRWAKLYIGGKQRWFRLGIMSQHDADKGLSTLLGEYDHGFYNKIKKISFADFSRVWLESYAKGRVRNSTLLRYEQLLKFHLIPHFGNSYLSTIHLEDIQKYISSKLSEGIVSPTTINRTRTLLQEMLKHAVKWQYLKENPAQYSEPLKIKKKEMNFLNREELNKFLNEIPKDYYPLFLFLILTGARLGEALAAKWANLDRNRQQYFVREGLSRGNFVEPKSVTSRRAIDLPSNLLTTLTSQKVELDKKILKMGPEYQRMDLIFPNQTGSPLDPGNLTNRIFKPTLRRAGIREIRIHDLRHTNAALRIQAGEHPKRMQRQLGHASIQVTLDVYGHLMEETNQEAAERLQTLIFEAN